MIAEEKKKARADMRIKERMNLALSLAREAGTLLMTYLGKVRIVETKDTEINLLTEADKASESMILSIIKKNFPGDAILAEESGGAIGSEITWIIDPLDGTTNFFHGLPIFTVSISLQDENEIKGAVIYDPNRNEMFHAVKGEGAFLNGRPIHVSDAQSLSMSLLATGFPYNKREVLDFIAETVKRALFHCHCLRRCGVATIDLAYVGCGRLDGFFEEGLKPWDISAGILLVREAGGRVTDYSGQPIHPLAKTIVASNEKIHDQILQRILMEAGWRSPEAAH